MWLTLAELADRYEGTLPSGPWVEHRLRSADRTLRAVLPGLGLAVADGTVDLDLVRDVLADAVIRRIVAGSGPTIVQQQDGPASVTYARPEPLLHGWFYQSELDLLTDALGASESQAFSIVPG